MPSPEILSLINRVKSLERWAREVDPKGATAAARKAFADKFEREADPEGVLDPQERAVRAERLRKAHYLKMALASAKSRAAKAAKAAGA